jgi:acetylornithine deacetylase/succinyl-diaminopimelate desuccinylase-like protein
MNYLPTTSELLRENGAMSNEYTSLMEETVSICQDLIRIPSVNFGEGRGDEKAVAEYIVASLAEVGIASQIYESAPNRCNVIANI